MQPLGSVNLVGSTVSHDICQIVTFRVGDILIHGKWSLSCFTLCVTERERERERERGEGREGEGEGEGERGRFTTTKCETYYRNRT